MAVLDMASALPSATEACQLGEPGQAQRHEQEVEHEQFIALAARHDVQPSPHDALPAPQQQAHQRSGFEQGDGQHAPNVVLAHVRQRGDEHQQRHHG